MGGLEPSQALQSYPRALGGRRFLRPALSALVVFWLFYLAIQFNRGLIEGPDWGVTLAPAAEPGFAVVSSVDGVAYLYARNVAPGDLVTSINGGPASAFIGQPLVGVRELRVTTSRGVNQVFAAPNIPVSTRLFLLVGALLFAGLGVLVYRWALDSRVGLLFLVIGTAFGTALVGIPDGQLGHKGATSVTALSALVAVSAFLSLVSYFPRPLRVARLLAIFLSVGLLALTAAYLYFLIVWRLIPPIMETALSGWVVGTVLSGLLLLIGRAFLQADRPLLAPIILGSGLGLTPVVLLNLIPKALGFEAVLRVEIATIAFAAVPLAFAYAILRRRLFALDAIVRSRLIELCSVLILVSIFALGWRILEQFLDPQSAILIAVALVVLIAPGVWTRVRQGLDHWLYPQLIAAAQAETISQESLRTLALETSVRVRQIVPVQWAAFFAAADELGQDFLTYSLLSSDGEIPQALTWEGALIGVAQATMTLQPIDSSGKKVGALALGARLDGQPVSSVDVLAVATLARQVAAPLEAALLREQAEDEALFREGVARMAKDLAEAATVQDVLRVTGRYAETLMSGDRAEVWLRDSRDHFTPVLAGPSIFEDEDEVEEVGSLLPALAGPDLTATLNVRTVARGHRRTADGDPGGEPLLVARIGDARGQGLLVVSRDLSRESFSARDERRLNELTEFAAGALNRAAVGAQAAEAETLRELDRVRTELLDIVTHDLQSPLTIIGGYAEMLETHAATLDVQASMKMASEISRAQRSAIRLVEDLLTTAKNERGRMSLHQEPVELQEFLQRLVGAFSAVDGGGRILLRVPEPVWVSADPVRLEQIVANLVSNALRYAPEGSIEVGANPVEGGDVHIYVRDHGQGIPLDEQSRIWEKFYRAEGGKRIARGTGIGLSVVQTLAELHGGHVDLESKVGEGSTFTVVLREMRGPGQDRGRLKLLA